MTARTAKRSKPAFNLKSFLIATLRRASYRSPARNECLKQSKIGRNQYVCNMCKGVFPRKAVAVDHVDSVVKITGWTTLDEFAERLFCDVSGLQVLCKTPCHREKTLNENRQRREWKKSHE